LLSHEVIPFLDNERGATPIAYICQSGQSTKNDATDIGDGIDARPGCWRAISQRKSKSRPASQPNGSCAFGPHGIRRAAGRFFMILSYFPK
jgi:hypothetical protein